ncbi:MAG TPA: 5'-methylthioadenosine/S-adenosylhomocysteine nucleosidase [Candidatus Merdivicinus intestinavium]|nr:5'-methylthioadenosine/S-adenosylhomocysteine nucleosidase [Candidatus Merdivicinus intestinavium]
MTEKIGLLCPSDTELAPFLPLIRDSRKSEAAMLEVWEGNIGGIPAAALYSGVCKVNAAIAAQTLISRFGATAVINAGVAGGIDPDVGLFDVVVTERCAYHDVAEDILTEFHPWMPSFWFESDSRLLAAARRAAGRAGCPVRFGNTATGEQFVTDGGRAALRKRFAPLSVDMETAAAAHVCYVNRVPFLAVRAITDTAEHDGAENFEQNCEKASGIAAEFVRLLLEELAED